ncbi:beta-alanine-activating enzyme isoform X6 [Dermochelys coriacea]|uniref:beta-alanine-activating enzyme isoform X6 n=1 Tax=Dermochelys coriacea TaxID=27794 RepID=UPI001CA9F718|nr:beta-alanine-activating enzyme isoform X6 [Dermochelys coriacea]
MARRRRPWRAASAGTEDYAPKMTLQKMVHQAASLYSDRKAVCFDECNDKSPVFYTYKEVVSLATELTVFLQHYCDHRGTFEIGLYCYPGINLPSWILGILQVPAAYSPLDPDAPPVLSTYFMKKCNLQYILVENDKINKFKISHAGWFYQSSFAIDHVGLTLFQINWNDVDVNLLFDGAEDKSGISKATSNWETDYVADLDQLKAKTSQRGYMDVRQQHSLAYILHTSGTTGIPKIVRVPHKCIVPNILHLQSLFKITPDDILFMASPLTFDPSVVELFIALISGASLLIVPNPIKMMPLKLSAALFHRHRVTVLQATPTFLRRFGAQLKSTVLSASTSLRVLALGGEAFPALNVLRSWKGRENKTHVFNLYGITEVSSWATCYRIPEEVLSSDLRFDSPVPLGSPLLGTTVEVRDATGSAVLDGEGQVFIGGKERICFLDDEVIVPSNTMRETGDFVRVKDAEMFFLGRKDSQIKRHGKRLNIECVQQAAEGLCHVETCAVIWYQQKKLILFVVPKDNLARDTLKELQKHLPTYAIPDELVLIETLPFTLHGCYNGLVYVLGSQNGEIHCIFTTEDAVKSSAVVHPSTGLVYIGSHDQHIYALDIYKKERVWKLHCEGGAVFSSPYLSILPDHLYVATLGGLLLAVNPDTGNKIWKSSCGKPLFSSPHCSEQYVCIGCVDGNVHCFSHSGEKVWQFSTSGPVFSSPCISSLIKQEIYFGSHDCFIYCCNMEGNLLWKFETSSSVYATPFVFHSHDLESETLLAATSTDGTVWVLNAKTGLVAGVEKLPGEVFSSPVVCGSKLVVGCRNDYVYCLDLCIAEKTRTTKMC